MWFTRLAINRPLLIWMTLAAIALLGGRAYLRLPSELNPRADVPTLVVTAIYPGANPPEVEAQLTKPLEEAIGTVSGVRDITSTSQSNFAALSVEFRVGTNLDVAIGEVRGQIERVKANLPTDTKTPLVQKLDMNARPILEIGFTCPTLSVRDLRTLADAKIRTRIERIPGIAAAQILGGEKREVQVLVDTARLAQNKITLDDVVNSLKAGGRDVPGGAISSGGRETDVRVTGAFTSLESVRNTPVLSAQREQALAQTALQNPVSAGSPPVPPLTIDEIAEVKDGVEAQTSITRVNGQEGVSLIVSRASDSNTVQVVAEVRAALESLRPELPSDLKMETLHDDGRTVRAALEDVNTTLILGAVLAMGVILLFLHNLRGTLIVSLSIPICIIATFLVIYIAGFTLNQMTLLALSLSVGILVDDSIVVLESITRHLQKGETPKEAAINGRAEIGFADLTTTLVDVVVFVPIAFMGGIVGGFFKEFGLTIATATLLSLVVSFSLTPMLASRLYKQGETLVATKGVYFLFERFYRRLETGYSRLIGWALGHRTGVLLSSLILVVCVIGYTAPRLGTDFIPGSDQGLIAINLETAPGSSLQKTDAVTREIEATLNGIPDVQARVADIGEIVGGFGSLPHQGSQFAQINLFLREKRGVLGLGGSGKRSRTDLAIADSIREKIMAIAQKQGARATVAAVRSVQGVGAPVEIQLRSSDSNLLANYATEALSKIKAIPGIRDPDISLRVGKPEVRAQVDIARAALLGVPSAVAGSLIRLSLTGNTDSIFHEPEKGSDLPLRVIARPEDRATPAQIADLYLMTDKSGSPVSLGDVATLTQAVGQNSIERIVGMRYLTLTAYLEPNALPDTQDKILASLKALPHEGITIYPAGDAEIIGENIPYFVSALGMAVLLVYFVMAALFNRLGVPFVILFALPMALAGAFGALYLTKESLSLVSGIGMLMLIGLMGRNAILLLDYTNTLQTQGMARNEALKRAGATRLRPILMTTTATIVGMLPVALRIGEASEVRAPMAIVVIGGLLVSTVLTLFVIPVLFSVYDDLMIFLTHKRHTKS